MKYRKDRATQFYNNLPEYVRDIVSDDVIWDIYANARNTKRAVHNCTEYADSILAEREEEKYNEKKLALEEYLVEQEGIDFDELNEINDTAWESFELNGREYAVFTDEEADYATRSQILDSLWAFNPSFVLEHTEFFRTSAPHEDDAFEEALKLLQERICEVAAPIIRALIRDIDEFVQDAINADGRGHFISTYDGEEHESNNGKYYIYRIN